MRHLTLAHTTGPIMTIKAAVRPAPNRQLDAIREQLEWTEERIDRPQGMPQHLHVRAMKNELVAHMNALRAVRDETLIHIPQGAKLAGLLHSERADELFDLADDEMLTIRSDRYQPGAIAGLRRVHYYVERAYGRVRTMSRMVRP